MVRFFQLVSLRIQTFAKRLVLSDYIIGGGGLLVILAVWLGIALSPKPDIALSPQFNAIKDRGVLRVGVHYGLPGLSYTNDTVENTFGLEPDIGRAVAMRLFGEENIELIEVSNNSKAPKLVQDMMDICVAQFVTDSDNRFSYSTPYYYDPVRLVVLSETYAAADSLAGQPIGVLSRAGAGSVVRKWYDRNRVRAQFLVYESIPDMLDALRDGKIAAFGLESSLLASGYVGEGMHILPDELGSVSYSIAVRSGDADLLALCNDTMQKLSSSGVLDQLKAAWNLQE